MKLKLKQYFSQCLVDVLIDESFVKFQLYKIMEDILILNEIITSLYWNMKFDVLDNVLFVEKNNR